MADFTIPQGSDEAIKWPVELVGGGDLTAGTVRAQARKRVSSPDVLHSWSSEDGSATIDDDGITLWFPGDVTSTWAFKTAVYGVEYVDADGRPHRVDQGTLTIDPEVAR